MELLVFVLATAMVLGGAVGVIVRRNPVHAALSLVLVLFGVAVHFLALDAQFLAAVQVIVYAGAIVVLFLFVIMLLGVDDSENLAIEPFPVQRPLAALIGLGIVGVLLAAVLRARDVMVTGTPLDASGDNNIRAIAFNLFGDRVFAFEFTSVLLIVAVVGTVMMTRRASQDSAGADSNDQEDSK